MEEGEECAGRGATRFSSARSEPYRSPSARHPRTDMTPTASLALSRHSAGHPVGAQKILSTLRSPSQSPSCTLSDGSGCMLSAVKSMKSRHYARGTCRRSTSVPWGPIAGDVAVRPVWRVNILELCSESLLHRQGSIRNGRCRQRGYC